MPSKIALKQETILGSLQNFICNLFSCLSPEETRAQDHVRRQQGDGQPRGHEDELFAGPGSNCIKIGLPENRLSETISKRIGLPDDLFSY